MIKENELEHSKKLLVNPDNIWGREGLIGEIRLERRAKMIKDFCLIWPGKRVLEIGCGAGALTEKLATTGAEITATDILPEFLTLTEDKTPNIKTQITDGETLRGLPNDYFDAVVGLSILHHLDLDKALPNIYRVLKKGGSIAFSEPNMLNPQIALQKNVPIFKKAAGDSPDETALISFLMRRKLKKYGFSGVSIMPFDFLHPSIPDKYARLAEKVGYAIESFPFVNQIAGTLFIGAIKKI